jgi:hypothetical protein
MVNLQWNIGEFSAPISHATFSCDSQLVYASFVDGTLRIFGASNLQVRCQINPNAYLQSDVGYYYFCFFIKVFVDNSLFNKLASSI